MQLFCSRSHDFELYFLFIVYLHEQKRIFLKNLNQFVIDFYHIYIKY